MSNPLIDLGEVIDYPAVRPEHIEPALTHWLGVSRAAVAQATDPAQPATWDAVVAQLDDTMAPLWRAWSVAGHLNAVVSTPELRTAYNAGLEPITSFSTWLGQHEGLFQQYRRLHDDDAGFAALSPTRQRILTLALRDFRLSGVELPPAPRARLAEIHAEEAVASQGFSDNVMDATDCFHLDLAEPERLSGLPGSALAQARQAAQEAGVEGYRLTLHFPSYLPVLQYAHDRELRHTLYQAHATRASELGDPAQDNSGHIATLLRLRAEEAALLGFDDFAARQLSRRMAADSTRVLEFLRDLAARARPQAEQDLQELRAYAQAELGLETLEPWDMAYATEHLRNHRYAYSDDTVRQYFPLPRVLDGLFGLLQSLYGLQLAPVTLPVWHADVQAYAVHRADGELAGHLYFDLYARTGKQGGAWVDVERDRSRRPDGVLRTPIVYLTCNSAAGIDGQPALLTHDDVTTLFHETGHAIHALLSRVDDAGAAPFASVEWDAIELPSQFMENFCWEWDVLQGLSAHVETGEPLPRELFERMQAARHFQSGLQLLRQIEFSLFDMLLHQGEPRDAQAALALLQQVRDDIAVISPPAWHRLPHSFSHIFAGGYSAGYYSYLWAEVLSSDAYAAFEEATEGKADEDVPQARAELGARLRDEILAVGGSRDAMASFVAFRGREPSIAPLLRHRGITG